MTLNNSDKTIIAHRREEVSKLRLRQLTQREIVEKLTESGFFNPDTDEPWSIGTINADCKTLEREWQREATRNTDRLKGEMWAELREVRRKAWESGDLPTVLRALKQECELLGLDAPTKIDITKKVLDLAGELGLDPDEAIAEANRIVHASGSR